VNSPNPLHTRFSQLLNQIRLEVNQLKKKNQSLIEEKEILKSKLEQVNKRNTGPLSKLHESEKISLQHQINGLISKIDKHLEE